MTTREPHVGDLQVGCSLGYQQLAELAEHPGTVLGRMRDSPSPRFSHVLAGKQRMVSIARRFPQRVAFQGARLNHGPRPGFPGPCFFLGDDWNIHRKRGTLKKLACTKLVQNLGVGQNFQNSLFLTKAFHQESTSLFVKTGSLLHLKRPLPVFPRAPRQTPAKPRGAAWAPRRRAWRSACGPRCRAWSGAERPRSSWQAVVALGACGFGAGFGRAGPPVRWFGLVWNRIGTGGR